MMKRTLITVMSLGITFSSLAADYVVPFDEVKWQATKNADSCNLFASDPYSGVKLSFDIVGGGSMRLNVTGRSVGSYSQDVMVESVPPAWGADSYEITSINDIKKTKKGLMLNSGSELIFRDIQGGAWVSVRDLLHSVTFPTANIAPAMNIFRTCTASLPSVHFEQAQNTVFHFKSGELALNKDQRAIVKEISELVISDPRIIKILITGYTDNLGDQVTNLSVSKRRAADAAYWMMLAGVDESIIEIRGQGSRYPIADNSTEDGRFKNRRIEIELVKK